MDEVFTNYSCLKGDPNYILIKALWQIQRDLSTIPTYFGNSLIHLDLLKTNGYFVFNLIKKFFLPKFLITEEEWELIQLFDIFKEFDKYRHHFLIIVPNNHYVQLYLRYSNPERKPLYSKWTDLFFINTDFSIESLREALILHETQDF
jgi:hypothetical protein